MNRRDIGINTYAINRNLEPIDTIRNSGIQPNGKHWLEHIMGGYVVGYANISSDNLVDFEKCLSSIEHF